MRLERGGIGAGMTVDSLPLSEAAIEISDIIIEEGIEGRDLRWREGSRIKLDGNVSRGKGSGCTGR